MKAVASTDPTRAIGDAASLVDIDLPDPVLDRPRDLLVRVHAVSVNPRDGKSRRTMAASPDKPLVLGYDASGVVEAVGDEVTLFQPGDAVFYAGVLDRPGSNAELQLVDERIVGRKPTTLDHAAAAALPLISLTAYEMLFDRLAIPQGPEAGHGTALLVLGGAGGVPSLAIQLARMLTGLTVIGSASRPESEAWVRDLGAHHVVDHAQPLRGQIEALDLPLRYVFSTHTTPEVWADLAACMAPQGRFGLIDDPPPLDLRAMKMKSISIHWEAMFTRPMFETDDMASQHAILDAVADLVDAGRLRSPAARNFGAINAANLRAAHAEIEAGRALGKLVLAGF